MSDPGTKNLREGSTVKREAILDAARDLFLSDGFDRTSVDAVAARATVSKRTVYDYFGDKRSLLIAVIDQATASLMASITDSLDRHLSDVSDLEAALAGFALDVAGSTMGSADYVTVTRLIRSELGRDVELLDNDVDTAPEVALAARLAVLGERGLLDVPDPRLAADHFIALTIMMAFRGLAAAESLRRGDIDRQAIVDGTRAFIRAYRPRP